MLNNFNNGLPGPGSTYETISNEFRWGRDCNMIYAGGVISSAAVDAGSTPTTTLRAGLVMGVITSSGLLTNYSATATDGSQVAVGILTESVNMLDQGGVAAVRMAFALCVGGPVKPSLLYGFDENARTQMAAHFFFDDRSFASGLSVPAQVIAKATNYTVVNGTDNGKTFTTQGAAGAVTFTLPTTIQKGQRWIFQNEAAQNMAVAAPAGKLVTFNNLAATSVTFSTAGNLIGAAVEITVNADGTKYVAKPYGANTMTVA